MTCSQCKQPKGPWEFHDGPLMLWAFRRCGCRYSVQHLASLAPVGSEERKAHAKQWLADHDEPVICCPVHFNGT